MMIDFALQAEREGLDTREAITQACLLRFRPIMMTTMRGAVRRAAARFRHGRRLGIAPSARDNDRRRPARQPGADPVYDAGDLSVSRRFGKWGGASVAAAYYLRRGAGRASLARDRACARSRRCGARARAVGRLHCGGPGLSEAGRDRSRRSTRRSRAGRSRTPRDDFAKGEWWTPFRDRELDRLEATGRRLQPDPEGGRGQLPRRRWR